MSGLEDFRGYFVLAEKLIAQSSKEEIAHAAQILALNLAHYQTTFGKLVLGQDIKAGIVANLQSGRMDLLNAGMKNLTSVLGSVVLEIDKTRH